MLATPLVAPSQGWASALRDYRALMSCDAAIPNALMQWILKVDEDQLSFLFTAWCRDPEGELLGLDEAQLQMISAIGTPWHGVVLSCAVDSVRDGFADSINDEWAQLIALHQAISDEKCTLTLKEYGSPEYSERLEEVNQDLNLVRQAFWDQTGRHIR
jgi:hypothetical protein